MNQEQKIQGAREGAFYLLGVLLTLFLLLAAIWLNWHIIIQWLIMTIFFFFLYRTFVTNAYQLSIYALLKYWKVNQLHAYYDRKIRQKQTKWSICPWFRKTQKKKYNNEITTNQPSQNSKSNFSQIFVGKQSMISPKQYTKRIIQGKKLFLHTPKEAKTITKIPKKSNMDRQTKAKEYLSARESYKTTLATLADKNIQQKWFEQFCSLVRSDYSKKVLQLIAKSNQNQQKIIALLQELFLIKVMTKYNSKIPQKVAPVHIDEAISQIRMIRITGCLPWTERTTSLQNRTILHNLIEIVDTRDSLDQILSTSPHLTHHSRTQLIFDLKKQVQQHASSSGRELLVVLMNLYNRNVKTKQFQLVFPNKQDSGIQIIQKQVGGSFHADLQTNRDKKIQTYCIKPGEQNPWCLLGMAAQIYRLRL